MDYESQVSSWNGYVDWKNKPAVEGNHGGLLAASIILVVEILENLAFLANASNLVLYLTKYMHFSPATSANIVTNFMGTAFLLALLGGFLCDAVLTTYNTFLISAATEFMGLLILTIQAHEPTLQPPQCLETSTNATKCGKLSGGKSAILFTGLYLVALGVGGIKGSLPPHGAEQFDEATTAGRKRRSAFFNYYVFCLSCGALIAVTFVVWIEDNIGWQWGFGVATLSILVAATVFLLGSPNYRIKVPSGSPITTIIKVLVTTLAQKCSSRSSTNAIMNMKATSLTPPSHPNQTETRTETHHQQGSKSLKTTQLTKSLSLHSSHEQQVQEVKIVLKTIPIFASTIMLNCCLAQLSTFSVQQAATMNTKLGALRVPPASLPIFPVTFIMILAPLYNHILLPLARKVTRTETGVTHLQRIGLGLLMSVLAMAVAAVVETKRKGVAAENGLLNATEPIPITFLWIALQYLFLGSADLFSLAGLMEFFFTEAPARMRSLATSLSWASLAMGYYLSSVLVAVVNRVTGLNGHRSWLSGSNLNEYHLERFYWLMCILSGINFLHYLFWACRYKYRSSAC